MYSATWITRPFGQAFRFTKCANVPSPRRVARVGGVCHEATIIRLVMAVVVDAIDLLRVVVAVLQRPLFEYFKRLPCVARRDPSSSVVCKRRATWSVRATKQTAPDSPQPRRVAVSGFSVPSHELPQLFAALASAGAGTPQPRRDHVSFCAAVTAAWVDSVILHSLSAERSVRQWANHNPASDTCPDGERFHARSIPPVTP